MKLKFLLLIILRLSMTSFSKTEIVIDEETSNSITLTVYVDEIKEKIITEEGINYSNIVLDNFGSLNLLGAPALPFIAVNLLTSMNPDMNIEVLDSVIEIRPNYLIYPAQELYAAVEGTKYEMIFNKDETRYKTNKYYPNAPFELGKTVTFRGIPITHVALSPIQFNPVTKELKIYKKLTLKISFNPFSKSSASKMNKKSVSMVKNLILNSSTIPKASRGEVNDFADDILIITQEKYLPAVNKLALWHRMKGYDVKIVTKYYWSTAAVKEAAHNFYNNTNPKPSYIIIFGDIADVSSELLSRPTIYSDLYFCCTSDNKDFIPEMARGRISVKTPSEAMIVVNKLINYEKYPPLDSSFYSNALASSYVQHSFVTSIERVNVYLEKKHGITSKRVYENHGTWNGTVTDVVNRINEGSFLVYHYDHGFFTGWSHPRFRVPNIKNDLTNNDLLPVFFNMDCLVGQFNGSYWTQNGMIPDCFAEELIKKEGGGAVGAVASTHKSYTDYNDHILFGLIDAIWPFDTSFTLSCIAPSDQIRATQQPIYTMGDVLDLALFGLIEKFGSNDYTKLHYELYHWFGDPTTSIWTKEPTEITTSPIINGIGLLSTNFSITEISCDSGIATLYNQNGDKIIGKKEFYSGSSNINIDNGVGNIGDTVIITITSHNNRPLIQKIVVNNGTYVCKSFEFTTHNKMTINKNIILINKIASQKGVLSIHNLKGKLVKKIELSINKDSFTINIDNSNLSCGVYLLNLKINNFKINKNINIIR